MAREVGTIQAIQQLIPGWMIPLFIFITYLGSLWVILPVLTFLYWRWDVQRFTFVCSAVLGGVALMFTLKNIFKLPRPPVSLHLVPVTGYGFPSGHAMDATVTYGSVASVVKAGMRWQRVLIASSLVGLIALSRVILGVHFVSDVVAGVGIGLLYLVLVIRVLDRQVVRCLLLATGVAVSGVIVTGATWNSMVLLGGALVALAWWVRRERTDA